MWYFETVLWENIWQVRFSLPISYSFSYLFDRIWEWICWIGIGTRCWAIAVIVDISDFLVALKTWSLDANKASKGRLEKYFIWKYTKQRCIRIRKLYDLAIFAHFQSNVCTNWTPRFLMRSNAFQIATHSIFASILNFFFNVFFFCTKLAYSHYLEILFAQISHCFFAVSKKTSQSHFVYTRNWTC